MKSPRSTSDKQLDLPRRLLGVLVLGLAGAFGVAMAWWWPIPKEMPPGIAAYVNAPHLFLHVAVFATWTLAWLGFIGLTLGLRRQWGRELLVLGTCALASELVQAWTPRHHPEVRGFIHSCVGVAVGLLISVAVTAIRDRVARRSAMRPAGPCLATYAKDTS